jgi:hypothetical protein
VIVGLFGLCLASEPEVVPPTPPPVDPFEEPLRLAAGVIASGYPRGGTLLAIEAIERHPDHPRAPVVRLQLSRIQRDLGLYSEEVATLGRGISQHSARWQPWFRLARMDAQLQSHDFAPLMATIDGPSEWPIEVRDAAHFYGAWGHLGVGDEAGAKVLLAKVRGPLEGPAGELAMALDRVPLRRRSPVAATLLNLIPGAGHAYAGDGGGAVADVLVSGGLGGATAFFASREQPVITGVFGVLTGLSVVGGMADAGQKASSYNRAQYDARFASIVDYWWLSTDLTPHNEAPLRVHLTAEESHED